MDPTVGGDQVLAARSATPEAFLSSGRLLYGGDRARLGKGGRVLVALDAREASPRRVRHLQRYPEAARVVLSLTDAPLVVVVCGSGERPSGPAAAFRIPGGVCVLVDAGVWHAGPFPLADTTLLELLEIRGPADHLDRRPVADLLGAEGLRVVLPDEPGAPGPGLDLDDEFAATLSPEAAGRIGLGLLALDEVTVSEGEASLRAEADRVAARVRAAWGPASSPSPEVAARLAAVRSAHTAVGWDPARAPSPLEPLLERALQGRPLPRVSSVADAVSLGSLDTLLPAAVFDRTRIAGPIALRFGVPGEGYSVAGRGRASVESRPVLADREGAFWHPTAEALRTRVTSASHRILVAVCLPPAVTDAEAARALDRFSALVVAHCGGEEVGRRVVR